MRRSTSGEASSTSASCSGSNVICGRSGGAILAVRAVPSFFATFSKKIAECFATQRVELLQCRRMDSLDVEVLPHGNLIQVRLLRRRVCCCRHSNVAGGWNERGGLRVHMARE